MTSLKQKRRIVRTKRLIRHLTPAHILKTRIIAGVVRKFAEKIGLVYFGQMHQGDEEYRLIRGHTVSTTHIDRHYSVGSLRGYDIAVVMRNDTILTARDQRERRCHWLIITIDLHTKGDLPHAYVGHRNRDDAFQASFEQLTPLYVGALAPYPPQFLNNYTVHSKAIDTIAIERMITPETAAVIVEHFDHASIEIEENTVYMYLESARPTEAQLDKLLSNGLWLAETIDAACLADACEVTF